MGQQQIISGLTVTHVDGHLYRRYSSQSQPQGTYIELDMGERALTADYNEEIGNGVPSRVLHKRAVRFGLPSPCLTARAINAIIDGIAERCATICDGYEPVWDGSISGILTDKAQALADMLMDEVHDWPVDDGDVVAVWDPEDWYDVATRFDGDSYIIDHERTHRITAETTDEEIESIAQAITETTDDKQREIVWDTQTPAEWLYSLRVELGGGR